MKKLPILIVSFVLIFTGCDLMNQSPDAREDAYQVLVKVLVAGMYVEANGTTSSVINGTQYNYTFDGTETTFIYESQTYSLDTVVGNYKRTVDDNGTAGNKDDDIYRYDFSITLNVSGKNHEVVSNLMKLDHTSNTWTGLIKIDGTNYTVSSLQDYAASRSGELDFIRTITKSIH